MAGETLARSVGEAADPTRENREYDVDTHMKRSIRFLGLLALLCIVLSTAEADDSDLFIARIPPDVLILLDMSGSMNYSPAGPPFASPPQRRIDMARSVIFDLLDDNDDLQVDGQDGRNLNLRLGYMRFWNSGNEDDKEPLTGSVRVLSEIGASFQNIWNKVQSAEETDPAGGTPLAASLEEARTYFTRGINPKDTALACRQKFVILITDGADSYACGGNGIDPGAGDEGVNPGMLRRRMLTVQKAKELYDSGMRVFVVGFGGSMPEHLKRSLNWAAKYGGTDNPLEVNMGDPRAYNIADYREACTTTDSKADPSSYPLSGYAFLAQDAAQLSFALKSIVDYVGEQSYSFAAPTVPSLRLTDRDCAFLSSFVPGESPIWRGNLKAYLLNANGTLHDENRDGNPDDASLKWDAGALLNGRDPASRKIYTYARGMMRDFTSVNLTPGDLEVPDDAERDRLIDYVRGIDAYDSDGDGDRSEKRSVKEKEGWVPWILGDIFHSSGVIVGSPSPHFEDLGFNGPGSFSERNKDRTKVILVGANDGMLHAFNAETGKEEWAFVPEGLLKNLKSMISTHTYYSDSTPKISDVWMNKNGDHVKTADEWKTVLVSGMRKGGKHYFALDITDTLNPVYLWEFPKASDSERLAKAGQSWSEPAIARVKTERGGELVERWVALLGGGFDPGNLNGKGFYVIDIMTGDVIKEFFGLEQMDFPIAASPTAVDADFDGYVDRVYIGDLAGQMWVFDIAFDKVLKKSESRWAGKRLFKAPDAPTAKHPIYHQAAVAFDRFRTPWVFFGTGDRENPKDLRNPPEGFYAVRDDGDGNYPREVEKDLSNVTWVNTFNQDPLKKGWYIQLEKTGQKSEKVLAKPAIFNRLLHFTTYVYTETADPCSVTGSAKLYTVEYLSGGGALEFSDQLYADGRTSERSREIGAGIPSAPVVSVDAKGKATVNIGTTSGQVFSRAVNSPSITKRIISWREVLQ